MSARPSWQSRRHVLALAATILAGTALAQQPLTFGRLAGHEGGPGSFDGIASLARFEAPMGVAVDPMSHVWVVDAEGPTLRRVSPSGEVTTLAGLDGQPGSATEAIGAAARFTNPQGIAFDRAGNAYVADAGLHVIRKISPTGYVTAFVGLSGSAGSADGTGVDARFSHPSGLAFDGTTYLYVADRDNHTIRKVTTGGVVTTLAGTAGTPGTSDGTGLAASFRFPEGLAVGLTGEIYVADTGNHILRRIETGDVVVTIAGIAGAAGTTDGPVSFALFNQPSGVALANGLLYVTDRGNHTVRTVDASNVATLAGNPGSNGTDDGSGSAASFDSPQAIAAEPTGELLVADTGNGTVRRVSSLGLVTTVAGLAAELGAIDATGSSARFFVPGGIGVDGAGTAFTADVRSHTIRRTTMAGVVTTFAGLAGVEGSQDGTGNGARFSYPQDACVDRAGNVYVADTRNSTIRKVTPTGDVTTLAGLAGWPGSSDGNGSAARFEEPTGVAADAGGTLYVVDRSAATIRKVTPLGDVTTFAGVAGSWGSTDGRGSAARFFYPVDLTVDGAGNVYVADTGNATIRKITPAGDVTTLAGLAGSREIVDGSGSAAHFESPIDVAVDGSGNLLVAESNGSVVRLVTPSGLVTTIAGRAWELGSADGTDDHARFNRPLGIAPGPAGTVYVSDWASIRIGRPAITDRAVIDLTTGPVGSPRQLDGSPQTATAWSWRMTRVPSNSVATIPTPAIRNPVFVPDLDDFFRFELTATSPAGSSISEVTLDTICAPAILAQSESVNVCEGDSLSLSVIADRATDFGWTHDTVPIPGATLATYDVPVVTPADAGVYQCVAWNACSTVLSQPVTVAVQPALPAVRPLYLTRQGSSNFRLDWNLTPGATMYQVFADLVASGPFSTPVGPQTSTLTLFLTLPPATTYYRVAAMDSCGLGPK